jgi:cysteine sulfinate desulfinase/cysteine desulfurase-like protein
MDHLIECMDNAEAGSLISIIMANNETGIIVLNIKFPDPSEVS